MQTPGGLLSVNFSSELLSMSAEVVQWERLRMAVPYVAMEIQAQRDNYRALRGHALALVRRCMVVCWPRDRLDVWIGAGLEFKASAGRYHR